MMKWVLFDFKTAKEPWFDELSERYKNKIKPYVSFDVQHLKTVKLDRDDAEIKKKFEEKILLTKITTDDFIILLDEKGKKINSIQFSAAVDKISHSGKKRGVFIIGGSYGVSETMHKRSDLIICLSDLTMNHLIAESMLLEQFYRAQTILNRIPYHNS